MCLPVRLSPSPPRRWKSPIFPRPVRCSPAPVKRPSCARPTPSILPMAPPSARLWTPTIDNKTVPYVVRIKTGTLNRAIYQTAMLHNPVTKEAPSLSNPPDGWYGRLVSTFGGDGEGAFHRGLWSAALHQMYCQRISVITPRLIQPACAVASMTTQSTFIARTR